MHACMCVRVLTYVYVQMYVLIYVCLFMYVFYYVCVQETEGTSIFHRRTDSIAVLNQAAWAPCSP